MRPSLFRTQISRSLVGVLALCGFALLLLGPSAHAEDRWPDENEARKQIYKTLGPKLPDQQVPGLIQFFRHDVLEGRLQAALEKRFHEYFGASAPHLEFEVIESNEVNAAIIPVLDSKKQEKGLVFVTSGMFYDSLYEEAQLLGAHLESLEGKQADEVMVRAAQNVAGVLAHELGHLIDKKDEMGIEHKVNSRKKRPRFEVGSLEDGKQAIELRADYEGTKILADAGLPPESMHNAFDRLIRPHEAIDGKTTLWNASDAFSSTHPPADVRMLGNRLHLTHDDHEIGKHELRPLQVNHASQMIAEIRKHPVPKLDFPTPQTIDATIRELRRMKSSASLYKSFTGKASNEEVRFTHLILHLDELIQSKYSRLTAGEIFEIYDFYNNLIRNFKNYPRIVSLTDSAFADFPEVRALHSYSHDYYLSKNPFYNSKEYSDYLHRSLAREFSIGPETMLSASMHEFHYAGLVPSPMDRLTVALDRPRIFPLFEKELFAALNNHKEERKDLSLGKAISNLQCKILDAEYADFILHKFLPTRPAIDGLRVLSTYSQSKNIPSPWISGGNGELGDMALSDRRMRSILEGNDPPAAEIYRKIAREIWEHRGRYGALYYLWRGGPDWGYVFQLLGIEKNEGIRSVLAETKKFASTQSYATFLSDLIELKKSGEIQAGIFGRPYLPGDALVFEALRGKSNPYVQSDSAISEFAESMAGRFFYSTYPEFSLPVARAEMQALLNQSALANTRSSAEQFGKSLSEAIYRRTQQNTYGGLGTVAEEIASSKLKADQKNSLLYEMFLKPYGFDLKFDAEGHVVEKTTVGRMTKAPIYTSLRWYEDPGAAKKVYKVLKDHHLVSSVEELVSALKRKESTEYLTIASEFPPIRLLNGLSDELIGEMREIAKSNSTGDEKVKSLKSYVEAVFQYSQLKDKLRGNPVRGSLIAMHTGNEVAQVIFDVAMQGDVHPEGVLDLYLDLANTYQSEALDLNLKKWLNTKVIGHIDLAREALIIRKILQSAPPLSSRYHSELAVHLSETHLKTLQRGLGSKVEGLKAFVEEFHGLNPRSSPVKDQFLERVLWTTNALNSDDIELVETYKSASWRGMDPGLIRKISASAKVINQLNREEKLMLIDWFRGPDVQVPAPLEKALYRMTDFETLVMSSEDGKRARDRQKQAVHEMVEGLVSLKMDTAPTERIPIYDLVLASGRKSLMSDLDLVTVVGEKYLNFQRDSTEGRALRAYIRVLPPEQRSTVLSYLISHSKEAKQELASMFLPFKTVGGKAAQTVSIMKLFGDRSGELDHFKDDMPPMTWSEINETLRQELPPEEFKRITGVKPKPLGSASVKTVVELELDGNPEKTVVAAVQRPHLKSQIKTNLEKARAFFKALKEEGVQLNEKTMTRLVDDMEKQLEEEISFKKEAEKIHTFAKTYEQVNQDLESKLNGWKFYVPKPHPEFIVTDRVLIMEKANGLTFKNVPESPVKRFAGERIVDGALAAFGRYGKLNADGHAGNYILDSEHHLMNVIDLGQGEEFSHLDDFKTDEVYKLIQLLRAFEDRNATGIVRWSSELNGFQFPDPKVREDIIRKVKAALVKKRNLQDTFFDVVEIFSDHDEKFSHRFSFGAMKGLTTIAKDGFASEKYFENALRREGKRVVMSKGRTALSDELSRGPAALVTDCAKGIAKALESLLKHK